MNAARASTRRTRPLAVPLLALLLLALSGAGGGEGGCDPPDDDGGPEAGLELSTEGPLTTSEAGMSASFTVALEVPPVAPVTVIVESGDLGEWSVGEAPDPPSLTDANTLELTDVLTLRYPHGPGAVTGSNGVHNQGYHFDGTWHYSVGTDTDHQGWLFVNHADGSLKCSDLLDDPFVGPSPSSEDKVHPGGGWFHGGRFHTVVANQTTGDGGGFGVLSFAPGACDAADNPDSSGCGCDVTWVQDAQGDPQLWTSGDYKGFGVGFADGARLYDVYGSNAWSCTLSGENCADADASAGPAGNLLSCPSGRICPQECFSDGSHLVCTDFPVLPVDPVSTYLKVYEADPAAIGEFEEPLHEIRLPRDLDLQGGRGHSNPEGIAIHDGQLYLAGDHPEGDGGLCGLVTTPCTDSEGDQVVRINRLVHDASVLTFTAENWDQPREVVVTGVDDPDFDGDATGVITIEVSSTDPLYAILEPLSIDAINVDDDAPIGPLSPQVVAPAHGTELGGQVVRIEGTGLLGTTEVWFGDVQATLAEAWEVEVSVLSPPGPPGTADVRLVRSDGEEATLPAAWTWHADHAGLYSGLARSLLVAYDPAHFWIGSPYGSISQPYIQLDGLFHEPIDEASTLFGASAVPGECSDPGGSAWTTVPAGATLSAWADPMGQADVPDGGGDGVYRLLVNDVSVWDWSAEAIDLEIVDDGGGLPPQYIAGAIAMPEVPDFGLYTWTVGNTWPRGQDFELAWATLGAPSDAVRWTMMPAQDVSPLNTFGCTMDGAGPLVVPWADIVAGIDEGQLDSLLLKLSFWTDATPILAHDGSWFWGRGYVDLYFYFSLL